MGRHKHHPDLSAEFDLRDIDYGGGKKSVDFRVSNKLSKTDNSWSRAPIPNSAANSPRDGKGFRSGESTSEWDDSSKKKED